MSTETSQPFASYVRVSRIGARDEDRLRSPEFQREAIDRFAAAEGLTVEHSEPELDVSGSKASRPILDAILERVRAGELAGVVVAKLDRLSRMSPKDRIELFDTVEQAGGRILSASEQLDPSTPEGRFARDVFLGVARMQWEKYAESWETAKVAAHERGMKIGPTPVGYVRGDDGLLALHPTEAPIMAEAFRLAAEVGLSDAHEYLLKTPIVHEKGKRKGQPRTWTLSTVRRTLANRAFLGEQHYGNFDIHENAHPALVDRATFEAAQHIARKRNTARAYPLSGLVACGICGEKMVGGSAGPGIRTYRCRASLKAWKGERCPGTNIVAENLEAHVREEMAESVAGGYSLAAGSAELSKAGAELQAAEAEEASLLADIELRRTLGPERFRELAARVVADADAKREAYREVAGRTARGSAIQATPEYVRSCPPEDLRTLVVALVGSVVVAPGRGKPVAERTTIHGWEPDTASVAA